VRLDLELEELALRHAAHRSWQARVEKADDRPEDPVRGAGIASMQPKHPPRPEAHHDDPIVVGDDAGHAPKAEEAQARGQVVGTHNP
jgi:hypothetical protein